MCCRFLLLQQPYREILQKLGITGAADFLLRDNVAPGTDIPVVCAKPSRRPPVTGPAREVASLRWGLVPGGAQG